MERSSTRGTWSAAANPEHFTFQSADAQQAQHARALFSEYLSTWADPVSDLYSAELIFGELVANVVQHAPGPLAVRVSWQGRHALLEVEDGGPGFELRPGYAGPDAEAHRGLRIVAALGQKLRLQRREGHTVTSVLLPVVSARAGQSGAPAFGGDIALAAAPVPVQLADALLAVGAAYDRNLALHMRSTAELARRTAEAMALDLAMHVRCTLAARLHDVGLTTIPKNITEWPGILGAAELKLLHRHSECGEGIILDIPALSHLAPIVRSHHEWVDGSGYPDGLIGDEIPLEARILAVADAFHAMTAPRPYRRILSPYAAVDQLTRGAGSQFDADVVAAFVTLIGLPATKTAVQRPA
jgi:HD-GYP domain-containing protein (c-di-GMP phosphodiesterase class II)